jgi:hypothetical protein
MSVFPYHAPSVSALARTLAKAQAAAQSAQRPMTHSAWLNALAQAAGERNYQAWRAKASPVGPQPALPDAPVALPRTVQRALNQFDGNGRLNRWPSQFGVQRLALWGIWMRLRGGTHRYSEREFTAAIWRWIGFDDPVLLRRELVEMRMVAREGGGGAYWKLSADAAKPSDEARQLMALLRGRRLSPETALTQTLLKK